MEAIDAGFRAAEEVGLAAAGLCLSVKRGQSAAEAEEMVERMAEAHHPRVVAVAVDGNERLGSNSERFASAFARAATPGLHPCAHAGESSSPEGARGVVQVLGARIDHGIRAVEHPGLVADLATRRVPLGICPTSNRLLGLTPDLARHPAERLRVAGVRVSLNNRRPSHLRLRPRRRVRRDGAKFDREDVDRVLLGRRGRARRAAGSRPRCLPARRPPQLVSGVPA